MHRGERVGTDARIKCSRKGGHRCAEKIEQSLAILEARSGREVNGGKIKSADKAAMANLPVVQIHRRRGSDDVLTDCR